MDGNKDGRLMGEDVLGTEALFEENAIVLESAVDKVGFGIDSATGVPRVRGIEGLRAVNRRIIEELEKYDYTGEEEERKANAKFLAAVRKFRKGVDTHARAWKTEYMAQFDADVKSLDADADEIIAIADARKKASQAAFEEERFAVLEEQFANTSVMDENLDGLTLDDFMDDFWLNRSTSESSAKKMLDERIRQFDDAVSLGLMPEYGLKKKAQALAANGWSVTDALLSYEEDMEAIAQAAAIRAQREAEKAAREAEMANRTIMRVSIANEDLDKFKAALDSAGVDWKEV